MSYHWNWAIFWDTSPEGAGTYFDMMMSGLLWTVLVSFGAWAIAFVVGSIIGLTRTLPSSIIRNLGDAYIELFRNIPLLMQLFIWFFVVPELVPHGLGLWIKQLRYGPFWTSVIGIGFYMSARVATQVTSGIKALPSGQRMAGTAIGLTPLQTYRYVLMPQAYRIMLPPLTTDFLNTIKNSSVALTIGVLELTAEARAMQEFSFQVFESFLAAAAIYLILNAVVTLLMALLERSLAVPGFNGGK